MPTTLAYIDIRKTLAICDDGLRCRQAIADSPKPALPLYWTIDRQDNKTLRREQQIGANREELVQTLPCRPLEGDTNLLLAFYP